MATWTKDSSRIDRGTGRPHALLLARQPARLPALSRPRMGPAGRRRPPPVRKDLPRRVPVRPVLADHPAQAREFPRRPSPVSTSTRSPRSATPTSSACCSDAGIVRHRGKIVSTINNAQARPRDWPTSPARSPPGSGASSPARTSGPARSTCAHLRANPTTAVSARISKELKKRGWTLRRPDHRLRLHAGHGPGQRPPRGLRLPRRDRERERNDFVRP